MTTIGNIFNAIDYWRSKKGGTVKANDQLINEIKVYMWGEHECPGVMQKVLNGVMKKIKQAKNDGTYHVCNEPGSYRGCWCPTLGSFAFNIEYDYDFSCEPERKKHRINFHLWGRDTWDFETTKCEWYDIPIHLRNIFEEQIPSLIAGDGEPFDITYNFYWELESKDGCIIF